MECGRCGNTFQYKSQLLRHLSRATSCPPRKSIVTPKVLIEKLERAAQKAYRCPACSRSYAYPSNLIRHKRSCERLLAQAEVVELRKGQKELERKIDALTMQLAATSMTVSPSPAGITNAGIVYGNAINTTNNIDARRTYNIRAWDPHNIDFQALDKLDNEHNLINKAFLARNQAEVLLDSYIKMDPPTNYSIYALSKSIDGVRVFDGQAFRKPDDPEGLLETGYQNCWRAIKHRLDTNESALRQAAEYYDRDFDIQKERLLSSEKKSDRLEMILDKICRASPEIKKVIDADSIAVD